MHASFPGDRLGGKGGVRSTEYGVRSAECGVRSAECKKKRSVENARAEDAEHKKISTTITSTPFTLKSDASLRFHCFNRILSFSNYKELKRKTEELNE